MEDIPKQLKPPKKEDVDEMLEEGDPFTELAIDMEDLMADMGLTGGGLDDDGLFEEGSFENELGLNDTEEEKTDKENKQIAESVQATEGMFQGVDLGF